MSLLAAAFIRATSPAASSRTIRAGVHAVSVSVREKTTLGSALSRRANSISRALLVKPPGASPVASVPAEGQNSDRS